MKGEDDKKVISPVTQNASQRSLLVVAKWEKLQKKIRWMQKWLFQFFSEICWGKAMLAYTKPEQRKKEESERLREERKISSSSLVLGLNIRI